MPIDSMLALIRRHVDAENRHDIEATLATLHPQCEFIDHAMGRSFCGHGGAREHYALWWSAFDLQVQGGQHYLSGDTFIAETRFRGRHHGEFMGVPATGRSIDLKLAVFVELRDGLMASERFYYDMNSLLNQLQGAASR